jgi:hypothetical protein
MRATEKEIKCIDYSLIVRNNVIQKRLSSLREGKLPLVLTPKSFINNFWQDYSTMKKLMPNWKKPIFIIIVSILYLILLPIIFVIRTIEIVSGDKKYKEKFEGLKKTYELDYETSTIKSFEQLWDDKGLRDWGMTHMHLTGFTNEDKMNCISEWFSILYNKDKSELEVLVSKIRERIQKTISDYYTTNPKGHITPIEIVQALPQEIDKTYGNYG